MEELTRFDYRTVDAETREFLQDRAERIHKLARVTAAGIVKIGEHLTEARERLKHGEFLGWIARHFAWSDRHAQRFMSAYECFKNDNLSDLTIDVSALFLIAAPRTPEPVRREAIQRAAIGPVTHATVKAVVTEYRKTGDEGVTVSKLFDVVQAAQRQDAEQRKALPSPAEARRMAIETGKHTLDRGGNYQPPMTVEQQAEWQDDLHRIGPLREFIRWVSAIAGQDAVEIVKIIDARKWRKDFEQSTQAAAWLTDFAREVTCPKETRKT